jgi:hypothetical protein
MFRARIAPALLAGLALAACDKSKTTTPAPLPTGMTTSTLAATDAATREVTPAPAAARREASEKEPVVTWKDVGLATPESVIHDALGDLYLVSNVNGKPLDADGNGFISRLTPDGKVENLKWIDGGKNRVTLNAPKGLALLGDRLYVADLDTVRIFDRKTGAPLAAVQVPGAVFLNGITVSNDGRVLVSDTGMKASAAGFEPAGSDAVYSVDKANKVTVVAKSRDLVAPNGLLASGDKTWVASFAGRELYSLDAKGKRSDVQTLPKGSLDGIVMLPGGDLLVASWEGNAVYRGAPGGEFKSVVEGTRSPAGIGYDLKRGRLLVPLFESDEIRAYEIN